MYEKINEIYKEYKWLVVFLTFVFTISLLGYFTFVIIDKSIKPKKFLMSELVIDTQITTPKTHYVPTRNYFDSFSTVAIPSDYATYQTFDSEIERERYEAYVNEDAHFTEEQASFSQEYIISDANQELYNIADKYYQVYWGSQRISPIYPLAVANVETGGRADHSITWSSLFPSKYVDISSLYTMDVTTVLSDESIYKALSTESSTRDRGALQMSPTYGTGDNYFNSMMSGTEKSKLSNATSHASWVAGASDKPGDRFYVPDVCLRLASANTDAINRMTKHGYNPESEMQLIAMLAMYHHRSGVWSDTKNKSCGEWKTRKLAFEYSQLVSSKDMIARLKQYAIEHEEKFWIDADVVKEIFNSVSTRPMSDFATKQLVCTYPIKVEYSYIKLCLMYSE